MPVFFGLLPDGTGSSNEASSLLYFLYETHQEFQLEHNPTETLLFPRDELLFFKLVLRQIELNVQHYHTDLLNKWITVCRHRILGSQESDDLIKQISYQVEQHLKINNLVDRVSFSRRIIEEFDINVELRSALLSTSYVVLSPDLDWFEHVMLQILIEAGAPYMEFRFNVHGGNNFSAWRLCNSKLIRRYKRCVVSDVLLSYLGLAVNMKDIIRLRLVMDNPPRSLGDTVFAILHRLSRVEDVSAFQVASSFVRRQSLQGLTSTQSALHPLTAWSAGLTDLVNCLIRCQDALSGSLEDTLLTMGSADGRMSVEEAGNSVITCLRQVGRIFSKPRSRTFQSNCGGENPCRSMQLTPSVVQRALKRLCERTVQLATSQNTALLCHETPNRPLRAGGSMYGRAASKLVRLLLVTEAERMAPKQAELTVQTATATGSPSASTTRVTVAESSQPAATPPRTPSLAANCTPTTDGRGSRLLPMFASPLLSSLALSPSAGNAELATAAEEHASAQPEVENEPIKIPTRPVFSRYQSNLDWAGGQQHTPPGLGRRRPLFTITNDEVDCHSLPAWTVYTGVGKDMEEAATLGDTAKPSSSLPTTPTKRLDKGGEPKGKHVLTTRTAATKNKHVTKNVKRPSVKANKSGQTKRSKANSGKAATEGQALSIQRTLTEFFRV